MMFEGQRSLLCLDMESHVRVYVPIKHTNVHSNVHVDVYMYMCM